MTWKVLFCHRGSYFCSKAKPMHQLQPMQKGMKWTWPVVDGAEWFGG